MEHMNISDGAGLGAGIGAAAFWLFVAAAVFAGVWQNIRKRDAQHETLRRIVESGQPFDQVFLDKLVLLMGSAEKHLDRDLKLAGLILLFVAPGLAVLGIFIGQDQPDALLPLLGVAVLVGLLSIGLLVTAKIIARDQRGDDARVSGDRKE
jgi:hypothetical protein